MTFDSASEKSKYVNALFARIAQRYDLTAASVLGLGPNETL